MQDRHDHRSRIGLRQGRRAWPWPNGATPSSPPPRPRTQAAALRAEAPGLTVEKLDITTDDVAKAAAWDLDVLIDNAGAGQTGPLADVPLDRVRRLFEVNVFGTLAVTQAVLPRMVARGSGRIIIMSSIAGVLSAPAFGPYSMTKHALEAMGKAMRAELAGQGVDVCLINPGPYLTGFNDRMADSMWEWFGADAVNAGSTPAVRDDARLREERPAGPGRGGRQAGRADRGRDHRGAQLRAAGAGRLPRRAEAPVDGRGHRATDPADDGGSTRDRRSVDPGQRRIPGIWKFLEEIAQVRAGTCRYGG